MTATAERILDIMQELIQARGFSAISYQHIADALQVTKASIHYHFPTKSGLGTAVVRRYRQRLMEVMQAVAAEDGRSTLEILDLYSTPYLDFADTPDKVCLCGALAGEYMALPAEMQGEVAGFFAEHQDWLERLLERGRQRGDVAFDGPPAPMARLIFSALQGGLLVKRTNGDIGQVRDVVAALKTCLAPATQPA
ncbi:MAG: TetR/AcrR family transcriptional regulator [Rhodospirillaceae bacterium]|nr:TetR/AcrR family transcriptional regulator [Rhodospirillaceae bacterium]